MIQVQGQMYTHNKNSFPPLRTQRLIHFILGWRLLSFQRIRSGTLSSPASNRLAHEGRRSGYVKLLQHILETQPDLRTVNNLPYVLRFTIFCLALAQGDKTRMSTVLSHSPLVLTLADMEHAVVVIRALRQTYKFGTWLPTCAFKSLGVR